MSCQGQVPKLIDAENAVCPFALKHGKGNSVEHGDNVVPVESSPGDNKLVTENSRNKLNKDDKKEVCDATKDRDVNESGRVPSIGNTSNPGICDSPKRKTSTLSTVSTASSVGSEDNELSEKKVDLIGLIESVGTLLLPTVSNLLPPPKKKKSTHKKPPTKTKKKTTIENLNPCHLLVLKI